MGGPGIAPERAPPRRPGDGDAAPDAERGTPSRDDDAPHEPATAMERKAVNDAVAYLRSLAELRGRDDGFAERAVRDAATLTATQAHAQGVVDVIAHDMAELMKQANGRTVRLARGEVTPDELLDEALRRVEALQPRLNCVTMLREDAARRLIAGGLPAGPLSGVPFLLKDLGAEAIDFPANNGSRLFAGTRWAQDSSIYARLKQAGLVRGRQDGRQTHYSAQLRALAPLIDWTSQMAGFWEGRFDQLENLLKRMDQ